MSWTEIGAIATLIGVVNGAVILPSLTFIRSMIRETIESRLDAIATEFDRVDERIDSSGDEDELTRLRGRIDKIEDRVDGMSQSLAQDYIDRDTWVRIEGGRDISMRHLREDVVELKETVAQLNERISD